jgi:hypothetical protein
MLFRQGIGAYSGINVNYAGLNTLRFKLTSEFLDSKWTYPPNSIYNNDVYNGFVNFTSVMKVPIFMSKGHFLNADANISSAVTIYKD